jgi:hypothetical protein
VGVLHCGWATWIYSGCILILGIFMFDWRCFFISPPFSRLLRVLCAITVPGCSMGSGMIFIELRGTTVLTEEIRRREHGSQRATGPNPAKRILAINKQITPKISNFAAVRRLFHALA